jgi:pyrimidine operon attenuation protein/uracil phosphoribosyltransferase
MKIILNAKQIAATIDTLTQRIAGENQADVDLAIVGIRSRGEVLAQRLASRLTETCGKTIPCGTLDITLYRDDINDPQGSDQPVVRTTEIPFDLEKKTVILVDDVLFTGRSTRAALDALIALGRPRVIRLAVLIDRGGREYPIQADYIGHHTDVDPQQHIHVHLVESDGKDEVVVE